MDNIEQNETKQNETKLNGTERNETSLRNVAVPYRVLFSETERYYIELFWNRLDQHDHIPQVILGWYVYMMWILDTYLFNPPFPVLN